MFCKTFLINFNLINKKCLTIWVVCDAECRIITTEPMVLLSLSLSLSLSLFLWDCGWLSPMLGCLVSGSSVWQKVSFQMLEGVFLLLQSTYGQSFTFPCKSRLRNALLHSRSWDRFFVKGTQKEKDSVEPTDSSDSVSISESHPTL